MERLGQLRESFSQTPRTLALVWRSSKGATFGLAAATLFSAALPLAIAFAAKAIIDAVVARSVEETLRWVLVELALVAGFALVQRGSLLLRQTLGARLALDINVQILEKALTLELRHFEDPDFYDRLTRARREASSRPVQVVTETFQMLQNGLTLAGYAAVLVGYSPWMVLGLVAASVPATLSEMRFSNAAFRLRNWRSPDTRRLAYLEYVLANDQHAKEVQVFGLGRMLLDRYRRLGERFYLEDRALAVRRAGWGWLLSLLATGAFYGAYAALALSAARGAVTLGELTLYVLAFRQGQQAFQSSLAAVGGMYEHNLYMSNLFEYLAIPVGSGPVLPPVVEREERGIRFENVGFRYPGNEKWAIRGLELFIPRGQSVALVGHNGAGKTTLVKLLARLYEPTEGRILLDGRDVRSWEADELRRRIGVVFQDFNEYQFKLRDNVGFGSVEHLDDVDRIGRAAERGGADEVALGLKDGLETPLGRWFKDGTELSGGQWQKVALARAFMREEAEILVLDEPTAALDPEAEHAIFERFRQLAEGRTTVLISHRFSTVRMADRILVLDGGRIAEDGSHAELIAAKARYAELFTMQAAGYR
jgi:ATP-binding cassette, subfamily B, bacterial